MLTLLGSLLGFVSSAFPDFLNIWKDRADRNHELAILDRQIEANKLNHAQRATVRPVITYAFFGLFATVKLAVLIKLLDQGVSIMDGLIAVWDGETQALFAAVMTFWFGQRALAKYRFNP
jgi:hypothetical protein